MRCAALLLPLAALVPVSAEVSVIPLFGDHAVLQSGDGVPVWGKAADGEKVTVRFAGVEASTVAAQGRWKVTLNGLKTSATGQDLVIQGSNTLTFHDVIVGEVWLCSGQSNMERQLGLRPPQQPIDNYLAEAAGAKFPAMRFFTVAHIPALTPADTVTGKWEVVTPESVLNCTAVGFFFGRALHQAKGFPVGLIHSSWGGTQAQCWASREAMTAVEALKPQVENADKSVAGYEKSLADYKAKEPELKAAYEKAAEAAKAANQKPPAPPKPPGDPAKTPGAMRLYNGMIAPLIPYALRGVIWYQGESDNGNPALYQTMLPTMIADWRTRWGRPDLPFFQVQIAPHRGMSPEIREAQMKIAEKTPNTGIVCLLDIGDATDIHPTRKRPVGERLALVARKAVYGDILADSGPRFAGATFADGKAVVRFSDMAGGLVAAAPAGAAPEAKAPLTGFTVAGADRNFVDATAEIQGDTVVVSAPGVTAPVAVRYAWSNVPVANLANRAGLPAFPFRSDEWEKAPAKK